MYVCKVLICLSHRDLILKSNFFLVNLSLLLVERVVGFDRYIQIIENKIRFKFADIIYDKSKARHL